MTTEEPADTPKRPALTLLGAGGAGVCEGDVCEIPVTDEDPAAELPVDPIRASSGR